MKIAYDYRQTAKKNSSFSPSATKPAKVMAAWKKLGIPMEMIPVIPSSIGDIARVHSPSMVRDILNLKRQNGFSNKMKEVADALPWVCGSMVTAATEAVTQGGVVFSPTSGAHHACYDSVGGFCTFNFLAMAAEEVNRRFGVKVGIIDCDAHYGNGTEDIIKHFDWKWITHFSMGNKYGKHGKYLKALVANLDQFIDCALIIFNAGADPHELDPLGGMLSTKELAMRDRIVIEFAHRNHIPLAISLAGGYQDKIENVIEIHVNTFKIAHEIFKKTTNIDILLDAVTAPLQALIAPVKMDDLEHFDHGAYKTGFEASPRKYSGGDFLNSLDDMVELYEKNGLDRTQSLALIHSYAIWLEDKA